MKLNQKVNKMKANIDQIKYDDIIYGRQTNKQTKTAARATHTNTLCHKHTQSHEKSYTHEHTSSQLLELLFFFSHQYVPRDEHTEIETQKKSLFAR